MSVLGKTIGFSVGLTLVFTLVTQLLPQVEGEAPTETKVDLGTLTMDDFVAMGEDLFNIRVLAYDDQGRMFQDYYNLTEGSRIELRNQ